jgi:hypothetical protein
MADDNPRTGLVQIICSRATIDAPHGADVTDALGPDAAEAFARGQQRLTEQHGCEDHQGCPAGAPILRPGDLPQG